MIHLALDNVSVMIYYTVVSVLKQKRKGAIAIKIYIKEIREASGMTQMELSKESGVSLATIRRIEAGKKPNVSVLEKLANAFGCPLSKLIEGNEKKMNGLV